MSPRGNRHPYSLKGLSKVCDQVLKTRGNPAITPISGYWRVDTGSLQWHSALVSRPHAEPVFCVVAVWVRTRHSCGEGTASRKLLQRSRLRQIDSVFPFHCKKFLVGQQQPQQHSRCQWLPSPLRPGIVSTVLFLLFFPYSLHSAPVLCGTLLGGKNMANHLEVFWYYWSTENERTLCPLPQ